MEGTIADSIIIKVGQGIMTIPRKINRIENAERVSGQKEKSKRAIGKKNTQ